LYFSKHAVGKAAQRFAFSIAAAASTALPAFAPFLSAFFTHRFRRRSKKLGLIEYTGTGDVTVRDELMTDVVLHD
jgi:hypothetical protein